MSHADYFVITNWDIWLKKNKMTKTNLTPPSNQQPNKAAVFIIILILIALAFLFFKLIFGSTDDVTKEDLSSSSVTLDSNSGKYLKEDLPPNFEYIIIADDSDPNIDKNQLNVEINQKLSEGQIATLAEELFNSKNKQRRFYIFYQLKGVNNKVAWATSHFDPNLEIEIFGSNYKEDNSMLGSAKNVDGNIVGIFDDSKNTNFFYTLYEKDGKKFMKVSFKDGGHMIEELKEVGNKYISKDSKNGEYYVLREQQMDFYNSDNVIFSTAPNVNK